jgi:ornithine cyclodeaminase/alanine dehydrogenase-like protein (mu-crystallin family)
MADLKDSGTCTKALKPNGHDKHQWFCTMSTSILHLSSEAVRRALPMSEAIAAMREAFAQLARGEVTLPPRLRMDTSSENGVALVMPCHSASQKLFSVKFITLFADNHRRGLPLIQSTVLLSDGSTGVPLAVMDGASLTGLRTGAASGLATDLLARPEATAVAIFGAGVQARTQLEAVACVRRIQRVRVFDRNTESAGRFAAEMQQQLGLAVACAASPAEAVEGADIICTATTSTTPVFDDHAVKPGAHINAVGVFHPDMAEVPAATVRRARVVVDHRPSALEEAGDLLMPLRAGLIGAEDFSTELGQIVLGLKPGRTAADEITLFKSVGVAIQDLCAASRALANAQRLGLGTRLQS